MPPCVRGYPIFQRICSARAGNVSLLARYCRFGGHLRCARGACFTACAVLEVWCLLAISAARAGNASLRARMPNIFSVYVLRARGMPPCVRSTAGVVVICAARAGNASLRARYCRFWCRLRCERGEFLPSRVSPESESMRARYKKFRAHLH